MLLKLIKLIIIVSIILLYFLSIWLSFGLYFSKKTPPEKIIFEVEKGKGIKAIAQSLEKKGIIKDIGTFLVEYELFVSPQSLKAGEYLFSPPFKVKEILTTLIQGKIYLHPLTVPEGLTAKEIEELLQSQGFGQEQDYHRAFSDTGPLFSWDRKAANLEGYLFPDTYYFPKSATAQQISLAMASQFKTVFNEKWQKRAHEIGLTIREVVILASLIEKETSLPEERRLVSAVFHNRLKMGMKLDCDPTIVYVLKLENRFEGRLHSKNMNLDSPYNTYLYLGLPPGPICNPGRESLLAALYPARVNYLYFVSRNDGSHEFSRTFQEQKIAVRKYQKNQRGRSPKEASQIP
jgi:UPF0755 protein